MTKKERDEQLTRLMEMTPPTWLTTEKYQSFLDSRDTLKNEFNFRRHINELFGDYGISFEDGLVDKAWRAWNISIGPKFIVDKYLKGELISDPTSGQDPKTLSNENLKTASIHAGRHWGSIKELNDEGCAKDSPSEWINFGTFNLITLDGKLCIVPINVEHRLWALIGFPLNLVKLESKNELWYYHEELPEQYDSSLNKMVNGIKVNGLYLSEIVSKCAENGVTITENSILKRFYQNQFKFQFLPFYSQAETEKYFIEINSSSSKTEAQSFHAEPHPIQYWVKEFSSLKVSKFTPAGCLLHPLFESMAPKKLIQLESMMITHTVLQRALNGSKFVPHSDKALVNLFHTNKDKITEDIKEEVINDLDWLYSLISKSDTSLPITKQLSQQFLKMRDYLDESGKVIADKTLFINSWVDWFSKNQNDSNGQMTLFAGHWRKSTPDEYKKAWTIILNEFLSKGMDIGILPKSTSVPRLFSESTIFDSYIENNKLDIDNTLLTSKAVGGHKISDMELIRMTPEERNQAAKLEGMGDEFDFDKNCRAMSSYHNLRMGVLRLSEYLPIIDNEKMVREARIKKYNELKQKEILI